MPDEANKYSNSQLVKAIGCHYSKLNQPYRFSCFRSPSSRGLGHRPFTAVTGVRIPLGTPYKKTPARKSGGFFICMAPPRGYWELIKVWGSTKLPGAILVSGYAADRAATQGRKPCAIPLGFVRPEYKKIHL